MCFCLIIHNLASIRALDQINKANETSECFLCSDVTDVFQSFMFVM